MRFIFIFANFSDGFFNDLKVVNLLIFFISLLNFNTSKFVWFSSACGLFVRKKNFTKFIKLPMNRRKKNCTFSANFLKLSYTLNIQKKKVIQAPTPLSLLPKNTRLCLQFKRKIKSVLRCKFTSLEVVKTMIIEGRR